jgi:hypothetical protein
VVVPEVRPKLPGEAVKTTSMKRYSVCSRVTLGVYTDVWALDPEDAILKAMQRGVKSLCHQCSSGKDDSDQEWCFGDGSNGDVEEDDVEVIEE